MRSRQESSNCMTSGTASATLPQQPVILILLRPMSFKTITAVIVTCNPPDGLETRINAILEQVNTAIIVDNASEEVTQYLLKSVQKKHPERLQCIWNASNIGLAAALNQGIRRAKENNAGWILLLDHDSTPAPGMITAMANAYTAYSDPRQVAILAPQIHDEAVATATRYLVLEGALGFRRIVPSKAVHDDIAVVITSGSLVSADIFDDVGLMPEHFFIDYIDYDFCLRLQSRKYRILLVRDAVLQHRLGQKTAHLGRTVIASNHRAERKYSIFRNRIWLWKRYGLAYPGFVIHDSLAAGLELLRVIFFEQSKPSKINAILKGIVAGIGREPRR